MAVDMTSADTGSSHTGVNLEAHLGASGPATAGTVSVGHTLLIIVAALGALWALGWVFRKVRI